MDFLVCSRATQAARTAEDEPGLNERHWTYMDGFADAMIARGPTLGPDRETWTGSLHVVGLPGPDEAQAFVQNEPYQQAGLFEEHLVRGFTNLLGHTMWQFEGKAGEPRFLVLAHATGSEVPGPVAPDDLPPRLREGLVVYGQLLGPDRRPAGVALAVQVPDRETLDGLLADPRTGLAGHVEVHDWEFGGRR